jgi:drug/metabolite transporter (DMT)-like permease
MMTKSTTPSMTGMAWLLLVILSLLWGGTFYLAEIALPEIPPFTLVFLRIMSAALMLHLVLRIRAIDFPWSTRLFAQFMMMGLLNNVVPFSLIFWGQTQLGAGLASILNAMSPIFTVVVAHFLTDNEKATGPKVLGVLIGFAGVTILIGFEAVSGMMRHFWAEIAVVTATVFYAFSAVYGRRFNHHAPIVSATGQLTASTVLMVPVVLIFDTPWTMPMPSASAWLAVLSMGLLSTALAYVLFYRILAIAGATNLQLVTFLIPATAILLGTALLDELLLPQHWLGMAVIFMALTVIDGRLFRRTRSAPASGPQ